MRKWFDYRFRLFSSPMTDDFAKHSLSIDYTTAEELFGSQPLRVASTSPTYFAVSR